MQIISMNKKNNNNWVLCPSKSFPGKFYYFNVSTGEAAWSLNELETKTFRKDDNNPKTSVKFDSYPEPNSPPVESNKALNTDTSYTPRLNCNSVMNQWLLQSPGFNPIIQAPYSNCILQPTPYIPNIMWTPAPLANQMIVPSVPVIKKQMSNQVTQTQEINEKALVQATGMPLTHRFMNYNDTNKKSFNFKNSAETTGYCGFNKTEDSLWYNEEKKLHNVKCQCRLSPTTEMLLKDSREVVSPEINSDMEKNMFESSVYNQTQTLDSSDLRLLLLEKKRNHANVKVNSNRQKEGNNGNKMKNVVQSKNAYKKRVSFELSPNDKRNSKESPCLPSIGCREIKLDVVCTNQRPISEIVDIHTLKSLRKIHMTYNVWFIMADLNVLFNNFQFIDNFVRQDEDCRLAIPHAILAIIKGLSSTLNWSSPNTVLPARNILRRLMDSLRHITLLESEENGDVSIMRHILDCCLKLLHRNFHVVLITTDKELFNKSKAANVHCYMLQQIDDKNLIFLSNNEDFVSQNYIKNNENDSCEVKERLFLQRPNEFQPYVFDNKPSRPEKWCSYVQNVDKENVKIFKKVVAKDLCDDINDVTDYKLAHREFNQKDQLNHKKGDSEKSRAPKVHRIISNEIEKGFKKPYNKHGVTFQVVGNPQSDSKESQSLADLNQVFLKYSELNNFDHINASNNDTNMSCKAYTSGENIVSQEKFKSSSDYHKGIAKNTVDLDTSEDLFNKKLQEKLKKYYVKNKVMSERIKTRVEEWMCCYTQVMENFMLHVLLENATSTPVYPCTVIEGASSIAKLFKGNSLTETAAYLLSALYNSMCPNGKLQANFNPDDLLKAIGCGMILVESLKGAMPRSQLLMESEYALIHLLYCIENPESDPTPLEFVNAPTVSRFEVGRDMATPKANYVKKPSEVLAYLKKHFPEWEAYDDEFIDDDFLKRNGHSTNIVRTVGRHLNYLKINHFNKLYLSPNPECDIEFKTINKRTQSDSLDNNILKSSNTDSQTKCDDVNHFGHILKHEETFVKSHSNTASRNIEEKAISKYLELKNEPLKNSELLKERKKIKVPCTRKGLNIDTKLNSPDFTDICKNDTRNVKMTVNLKAMTSDVSNDDSGLGNENCPEHIVVKNFLIELSSSLTVIHKFMNESVLDIKRKDLEANKKTLHDKAETTYKFIVVIIDKLKSIIEREPEGEGTIVKSLLIKAGVDVANDKRVSRYKQVVTKCLEQANLLKNGLKLLLNLTKENLDSQSTFSEPDQTNVCYLNIFE